MAWEGDALKKKMDYAIKMAINKTMEECVRTAKNEHPWQNRTTNLQGSIQLRVAYQLGSVWIGVWGSFNVKYAKFLELGTAKMQPYPFLRPSADKNYPHLKKWIKHYLGAA